MKPRDGDEGIWWLRRIEADLICPVCALGTFPIVGKAWRWLSGGYFYTAFFAPVSANWRTVREAGPYGIDDRSCRNGTSMHRQKVLKITYNL